MNDILRAEAVSRDVELMEEGVRLAMLEQASTKHRQAGQKRRKKRKAANRKMCISALLL
jgi:hypothetical protein